jgi:hypothetical protein
VDADSAYAKLRPYLAGAIGDAATELMEFSAALMDGDAAADAFLRSRIAIGESYGWNLYELDTAWDEDRLATEIRAEAADLIVYAALRARLQALAARRVLQLYVDVFRCDVDESGGARV